MWTVATGARDRYKLHWIHGTNSPGLSRTKDKIHTGDNSGYQAIGLAHFFGASKIVLIGFDFQRTGGKSHWHGNHPNGLGNGGNFSNWCKQMSGLAHDAKQSGLTILNCSRVSALTCFARIALDEALPQENVYEHGQKISESA